MNVCISEMAKEYGYGMEQIDSPAAHTRLCKSSSLVWSCKCTVSSSFYSVIISILSPFLFLIFFLFVYVLHHYLCALLMRIAQQERINKQLSLKWFLRLYSHVYVLYYDSTRRNFRSSQNINIPFPHKRREKIWLFFISCAILMALCTIGCNDLFYSIFVEKFHSIN